MAAIASLWFRRRRASVWLARDLSTPVSSSEMVLSQSSKPSISSSPWMRGAPQVWILSNHPEDPLSRTSFGVGFLSTGVLALRDQLPVQAKTSPMPANYGFQMQSEMGIVV
ncbi:MAG TPA: hypothetical protein VJ255_06810 [Candidatus Acidoferrum sp.]|nr:hypothetical protein [Candidatus Acidoferrum sp.]